MIYYITVLGLLLLNYFSVDFSLLNIQSTSLYLSILYIAGAVYFLKKYRKGFTMSFELIFFIIFFFVTYSHSLIPYNEFNLEDIIEVNRVSVIKSIYLATIGFYSYLIGATVLKPLEKPNTKELTHTTFFDVDYNSFTNIINKLTTVFLILFLVFEREYVILRYSDADVLDHSLSYIVYLRIFIIISTVYEFIRLNKLGIDSFHKFIKNIKKNYLFNVVIPAVLYFVVGYRSEFLTIAISVLFLYIILIKEIKFRYLLFFFIIGFWVLALIKYLRGYDNIDMNRVDDMGGFTFVGLISEFFISSITLYELVDYTDIHGCTHGSNIVLQLSSFIPFLQSFIVKIFSLDYTSDSFATSSVFISDFLLGKGRTWGLGTHVIGDLYYTFGFSGVVIFMGIFGFLISYLTKRIVYQRNFSTFLLIIFIILFSQSFFFSRVEFFRPIRDIGFTFWIYLLINFVFLKPVKKMDV